MKSKNKYFKNMEKDLIYIIVLLMAIMIDYHIVPDYLQSNIWRIDTFFLIVQGTMFISSCLLYLRNRNNADMQEEIDIIDEALNDFYDAGNGKILYSLKSIITNVFLIIIVVRLLLHIIGIEVI